MDGPRAARVKELPLVEELSNRVFRTRFDDGQTMFQEFPELFSIENIDNVRVVVEDGIPVSNMNYVIRPVSIYGCTISVASLGAVATREEYRGRGYASVLLDDCINRMNTQGVHVLLISGDRRLYRSIGSLPAGWMYNYIISDKSNVENNMESKIVNKGADLTNLDEYTIKEINIEECSNGKLHKLAELYRKENVRFIRRYDEFHDLLLSRKFLRKTTAQKKVITLEGKEGFEAYMYMGVDGMVGSIYDCAGPRELIIKTCAKLVKDNILESVYGRLMPYHRSAIGFCKANNINLEEKRLIGTMKIVNFKSFMETLRKYFYEIYNNGFIDKLEFVNDEKGACFKLGDKKCIVRDKGGVPGYDDKS